MIDDYEKEFFEGYKDLLKLNFFRVLFSLINAVIHIVLSAAIIRQVDDDLILKANLFALFFAPFDQCLLIAFYIRAYRPKLTRVLMALSIMFLGIAIAIILII